MIISQNLEVELFPLPSPAKKRRAKPAKPARKRGRPTGSSVVQSHVMHVTPLVRKYLSRWLPDMYEANQTDFIGMWLINALTRKTKQVKVYSKKVDLKKRASKNLEEVKAQKLQVHIRKTDMEKWGIEEARKYGYLESWKFTVPKRYQDNVVLPKRRVQQFNNMILKFMYMEMFLNMEAKRIRGELWYIHAVIYEFREQYSINDNEFNDERIRRAYLRYRASNNAMDEYVNFFAGSILR